MSTGEKPQHWQLEYDDNQVAWLTLDRKDSSANSLSQDVLEELNRVLESLPGKMPKALMIKSGKPGSFIVGADIYEFTQIKDKDSALKLILRGQEILGRIESLPIPTIALIDGNCLGGGLELALACRYRIATDHKKTRLGLPEVKLGIHPGFGGTVRLIRLIGPLKGLDLMLTGRTVAAKTASKLGLVNHVVADRHLLRAAKALAAKPPRSVLKPLHERLASLPLLRGLITQILLRKVKQKVDLQHYPAPFSLLELWKKFTSNPSDNYLAEATSVAELITTRTSKNLVRVFLLQEKLKATGRNAEVSPKKVHVVGGGVMGGDIASWCALQGMHVTVQDMDTARLGQVIKQSRALFSKKLKNRRDIEASRDRLIPDPEGYGIGHADLIIEAIFENAEAKRELYRNIEPRLKANTIIASNTSSIPLEELAGALNKPERLIGLHFFNPVEKMLLVEVVEAAQSSPEMIDRGAAFVRAINRLPLPVKSSPGFLVNRILMPYLLEAVVMVEEGVSPSVIDQAATGFGMPMGPIKLADTVGLDICLSVAKILSKHYQFEVPKRLKSLVEAGHLGRKSGRGFYNYSYNRAKATKETAVSDETQSRLILRLLNESVACWREQVVTNADMLDAGVIFGAGFAPFRAGPMHYIETTGVAKLHLQLEQLSKLHGSRFDPDNGWSTLLTQKHD